MSQNVFSANMDGVVKQYFKISAGCSRHHAQDKNKFYSLRNTKISRCMAINLLLKRAFPIRRNVETRYLCENVEESFILLIPK